MSTNISPVWINSGKVSITVPTQDQAGLTCAHCQLNFAKNQLQFDDQYQQYFCCDGCKTVYQFMQLQQLGQYYELRGERQASPVNKTYHSGDFAYLDDPSTNHDWVSVQENSNKQCLQLYIEGVDCQACLWALSKLPDLPRFQHADIQAKLNGEQSTLTLEISRQAKFDDIMTAISQMGMKPHPLRDQSERLELEKKERRRELWRLAVAGASAGNAMLFAVPYYVGADLSPEWGRYFEILILLISLPAITYSAVPYYEKALGAIFKKQLSLDLPIALAIFFGTIAGIWGLFANGHLLYVDSLAALVFLLSLSRFSLKGLRRVNWSAKQIQHFFDMTPVERWQENKQIWQSTPSGKLMSGDRIRVSSGQLVPVDATLSSASGVFSLSYITGETEPQRFSSGQSLKAGSINAATAVEMQVRQSARDSYLGKMLASVGDNWRERPLLPDSVDHIALPITAITLLLAVAGFFYGYSITGSWQLAFQRFLTIAIVSCPCALGIAAPLTWMRALSQATGRGIVIKDEKTLERIGRVRSIYFDKTGTLSHGRLSVEGLTLLNSQDALQVASILLGIEQSIQHPIALAITEYVKKNFPDVMPKSMSQVWPLPGKGIAASCDNVQYKILSTHTLEAQEKRLVLTINDVPVANINLKEVLKNDTSVVIKQLSSQVDRIGILSGDAEENVKAMAKTLGMNPAYSHGQLSALDKQRLIEQEEAPMMVGDGANDLLALSGKAVGVVVQGGLELSMQSADVWLAKPGLSGIGQMLQLARNTKRVLKRNVILSIAYNTLTITLAFSGILSPLMAAILMPLSSLAVLLNTMAGPYITEGREVQS